MLPNSRKSLPRLGHFIKTSPINLISKRTLFGSRRSPQPSPLRQTSTIAGFIIAGTFLTVYYLDPRSSLHRYILTPILRNAFDAETGHKLSVRILKSGLGPKDSSKDDDVLKIKLWGEEISNPIGLAAGFDKNGEAIDGLFDLGFGWVEIGSVTPYPQPGNPLPRVFHLPSDEALINRYGFPSQGSTAVLSNLRSRVFHSQSKTEGTALPPTPEGPASLRKGKILAINLGKNKSSPVESIDDFLKGVRDFGPWADAIVINVSSPNTPGLRSLQSGNTLPNLIKGVTTERDTLKRTKAPRILLKLAPDLSEEQLGEIASAIINSGGIDGVIVSNTTTQRPANLISENKTEQGGLSGPPLFPISLKMVKSLRQKLPSDIPIIGCGGISSGHDAIEFAKAGAVCVQLYTAFGYGGPGTARRIKDEVVEELKRMGTTWSALSEESVEKLALKGSRPEFNEPKKVKESVPHSGEEDINVKSLIEEAERLKGLLEKLEAEL